MLDAVTLFQGQVLVKIMYCIAGDEMSMAVMGAERANPKKETVSSPPSPSPSPFFSFLVVRLGQAIFTLTTSMNRR